MTTFKEIRGTDILALSSDPANPELGQIWYNSSSGTLKGRLLANVNAWSSAPNVNTARYLAGGTGTQTAALAFGGQPGSGRTTATESYSGSAWTTVNSLNNAISHNPGFGTQTAAVSVGGINPSIANVTSTEKWNGTSWTNNPTGLNTAKELMGSAGTQTAGLVFGGYLRAPNSPTNATESFNGSTWTNLPATLNTSRYAGGSAGTQTAALFFGGGAPALSTASESYNGTSWTSTPSLNTARQNLGGAGTQIAAIAFGGYVTGAVTNTELYNGTTWTNNPTGLSSARSGSVRGITGSQTAALAILGEGASGYLSGTEQWTGQALQTKTITVS